MRMIVGGGDGGGGCALFSAARKAKRRWLHVLFMPAEVDNSKKERKRVTKLS